MEQQTQACKACKKPTCLGECILILRALDAKKRIVYSNAASIKKTAFDIATNSRGQKFEESMKALLRELQQKQVTLISELLDLIEMYRSYLKDRNSPVDLQLERFYRVTKKAKAISEGVAQK